MKSLQSGQVWSGEFIVKKKNGTEIPIYVTDSPIKNDKNELIGIIGVTIDLSNIKAEQQKLEEMNKLMVGRELRIKELREEIKKLKKQINN